MVSGSRGFVCSQSPHGTGKEAVSSFKHKKNEKTHKPTVYEVWLWKKSFQVQGGGCLLPVVLVLLPGPEGVFCPLVVPQGVLLLQKCPPCDHNPWHPGTLESPTHTRDWLKLAKWSTKRKQQEKATVLEA